MSDSTRDRLYTERLLTEGGTWKRIVPVQAPYRWNLRQLAPGFILDVGCGIGRNLIHLDGNGVGIDHNAFSIEIARSRGLEAFTPEDFNVSQFNRVQSFDSILAAHVLEHMTEPEAIDLVREYEPLVKKRGRLILVTPQEAGFASDSTHVQFLDFPRLRSMAESAGFPVLLKEYSFPLPRCFGRLFKHNEFVVVYKRS